MIRCHNANILNAGGVYHTPFQSHDQKHVSWTPVSLVHQPHLWKWPSLVFEWNKDHLTQGSKLLLHLLQCFSIILAFLLPTRRGTLSPFPQLACQISVFNSTLHKYFKTWFHSLSWNLNLTLSHWSFPSAFISSRPWNTSLDLTAFQTTKYFLASTNLLTRFLAKSFLLSSYDSFKTPTTFWLSTSMTSFFQPLCNIWPDSWISSSVIYHHTNSPSSSIFLTTLFLYAYLAFPFPLVS